MDVDQKEGLFRFVWQVDRHGYRLVDRQQPGGERIRVIEAKGGPVHPYRFGKEHEGLHRRFASLDQEPEAVLEFADEFGLLWQPHADFELYEKHWLVGIGVMKAIVAALDERDNDAVWDLFNSDRYQPRFTAYIEPNKLVPRHSKFKLQPVNLMGAMWLQVAEESTKGINFNQCEFCPNWFPVGPGTGRKPSKRFCSDRCRVAWHRQQKKEASS